MIRSMRSREKIVGSESGDATKDPIVADEEVEGWAHPLRHIVLDCGMKFEQVRKLGTSPLRLYIARSPPIRKPPLR